MKAKLMKAISSVAMAGIMALTSVSAQADEAIDTVTEPQTLSVYCPTNNDSEFPFNLDVDVDPDSIRYIELDKPVYGFDSLLDGSVLDFDVKFSLKDEFKYFDGFKFRVFNADYSDEFYSDILSNDEVVTLPGLSLGKCYKINMTLE